MPGVSGAGSASGIAVLKSRGAVSEACILSTCNRVEITVTTEDAADPQALVDGFLQESRLRLRHPSARIFTGTKAAGHPPSVPRGLQPGFHGGRRAADSGPAQDCLRRRQSAGAVCGWLEGLLTRAFSVAKRVRSETGIGQMAVSVSYAAVELARKIFGSLDESHRHDRGRRQDVRAGRAPPAPLRRVATSSSPTGPTSAPTKWPGCSRARRSNTPAFSACCRRWIS